MTIDPGTQLGRYEIRSKIGEGGMGEVYLAQDTKLDRKVALKILPSDVASDQNRMRRFVQEAKAASALNHPNILTIYEIDQADSGHFIATEFIDGQTLRERTRKAPLKLGDVLDVAGQIASALSAAHASGIIHRDIKPENVMLRRDGIVKVLDFGLAKLTERLPPESVDTEAPTSFKTDPDVVMGTAIYMSPEQARGMMLDVRTDIFSLGVVIYEIVAGCLPFEGSTSSEVMASILSEKEPQPLARYSRDVPAELERIVSKALRKEREQRYQTTKDLMLDLQSLKQQLEFEAKLERSTPPELKSAPAVVPPPETVETITQPTTHSTSKVQPLTSALNLRRNGVFLAAAAVLILAAATAVYFYFSGHQQTTINSIAVLPFVNASADAETEYLSDGITESLINSLSQLPNLKMIARSSVFRYKGKEINLQAVGRELDVQAVLMGRVVRHADGISISVELVNVRDNSHLWGEQYDRKLSDLLALQKEIAKEISEKLRVRLTGEDQKRVTKSYTDNAEAYDFYLKGRYHLNRLTDDGFMKGRDYFQQAIDKDPNYALAYAGLADAYNRLSGYNALPPREGFPRARAAAMKALELDDKLAEAHTVLGAVNLFYDWNWSGAEREFKRAVEINQSNSDAHQMYSYYLSAMGRFDEALYEMRRAQELDPLSLEKIAGIGEMLSYQRQYDQALEQYRKALEMDPNSGFTHWAIGSVYVQKGLYEEAIAEYQKSIPLSGDSPDEPASLGYAYALSGKSREAHQVIDELKERSKRSYISPTSIAIIYTGLGEKDQAFAWLDKAYDGRDSILVLLKVEPMFDSLRSDPRFLDLMRRVGLPP